LNLTEQMNRLGRQARDASAVLAGLTTATKNAALATMAAILIERQAELLSANAADLTDAREAGLSSAMLDRLTLNPARIATMAAGLRELAALPDPIGEIVKGWRRPNGLLIEQVRVPLGVIGFIYESRPNVTADAAGLCLKSGNALILRGGKEALRSNLAIAEVLTRAGESAGLPAHAMQMVDTADREAARLLMRMNACVDVLIPRGGPSLIGAVVEHATIPILFHGAGICHTFIDESADAEMAERIVLNAKAQRPSVCNAMETLLVHTAAAPRLLPQLANALTVHGVALRGCERSRALVPTMLAATEADWDAEYLDLILAVRVVDSVDDAIAHIHRHGTKLAESIVTNDLARSRQFLQQVDAAAVYVNASTRFTDGGEFGFGGELGISTGKLHARGPLGLEALTTTKYWIHGEGQVRE